MHVRLPKREGVNVRHLIQVREGMVDESVGGLVAPNGVDDVQKRRVGRETPIVFGDLGCRFVGPAWKTTGLDFLDATGAGKCARIV